METTSNQLTGKLLIAMPGMGDTRFDRSVIYICNHNDDGALGIIVNKPAESIDFNDLLVKIGITPGDAARHIRVHFGGPVENGRGFVLHSSDYGSGRGTLRVNDAMSMTATTDVLEDLAQGRGPTSSFLALGYSGWGPGQLEDEIARNGWLTCDADNGIVFGSNNDGKWEAALKSIGIDPRLLSGQAGHA